MGKERFCPDWLFKIIISQTVYDYIVRDVALFISARKFISFFSKYYDELTPDDIEATSVAFIEFLGETNDLNGFPFQRPVLSMRIVPLVDFVYGLKVFNAI